MKSINREYQHKAMEKEINDLKKQNTQTLVIPLKNNKQNIIKGRWVYRTKLNKDGKVDKYKVRQITKGFQ